jgi:DNA-binding LytR/AlgR family response regulator
MWQRIRTTLRQPFPFYLNSDRDNLLLATGIAVFTFFFFRIFQPFGMQPSPSSVHLGFSVVTWVCLVIPIIGVPRLFTRSFDPDRWNLGKFIVYTAAVIFLVTMGTALYEIYALPLPDADSYLDYLVEQSYRTMTVGLFPLFFLIFMIRNRMLLSNLKEAQEATRRLELRRTIAAQNAEEQSGGNPSQGLAAVHNVSKPITIQADTQDSLALDPKTFLYAEADDNYSRIYWHLDGQTCTKMMRLSLKHLEEQITEQTGLSCIARVHRSFLVDLSKVDEVRGNASGYKLWFAGPDVEVPVSRMKSKEILSQIPETEEESFQPQPVVASLGKA